MLPTSGREPAKAYRCARLDKTAVPQTYKLSGVIMDETYEQQMKDSDMIFNQITSADFKNFKEAERAIVSLYVIDRSISRSGISHVLKRIEKHFSCSS